MKPESLRELLAKARRGRPPEGAVPFGFASRVSARWARNEGAADGLLIWERLTRWGLFGALAACIVTAGLERLHPRVTEGPGALEAFAGLVEDEESF